jgi:hypothetical protein
MAELATELRTESGWVRDIVGGEEFDVEALLTRLELPRLPGDRLYHVDAASAKAALQEYLASRLSPGRIGEETWRASEELCARLFTKGDTLITFNYDCLLERILWSKNIWSPKGGYGSSPGMNDLAAYGSQIPENPLGIVILKLHGSLCFERKSTDHDEYLTPVVSNEILPGIHSQWGNKPHPPPLTLPTYAKVFGDSRTMLYLWREAAAKLSAANDLAVIGYSMPRYDTMARFLVSCYRPTQGASQRRPRIDVLTNSAAESCVVFGQIRELGGFGPESVETGLYAPATDEAYLDLAASFAPFVRQ